ncbi:MAG: phosphodiester glycosidase family protein [Elusimicrobia bacterium]|nr:phosphodiester glycosidase family protein [Elusimicrobiota bacterium]
MQVIALLALCAWGARAEDLASGVRYFNDQRYHVIEADLDSPQVQVRVSAPRGRDGDRVTVSQHAQREGAVVGLNANYFGGPYNVPCGAARGHGAQYENAYGEAVNCETSLGWAGPHGEVFNSAGHETDASFNSAYTEIVTGGGYLLSGGRPRDWNHGKLGAGRDCTAAGLSADRRRFVAVVTQPGTCSGQELQAELLRHGAADAILLDGGGSSKLWIGGRGYVNGEPQDRKPPVTILIFAAGSGSGGGANGACPSGNGLYCGGDGVTGDSGTLFRCASGTLTVVSHCANGCESMPAGVPDRCRGSGPSGRCPSGNGLYCGGDQVGGTAGVLYRCAAGALTEVQRCANNCHFSPPGQPDYCR